MSGHAMLAAILDTPELELDPSEAQKLHEAATQAMRYYAVSIDPKKLALFNLLTVAGGVYGTRLMAYRARKRRERAKDKLTVLPGAAEQPRAAETPATAKIPDLAEIVGNAKTPSQLWQQSGIVTAPIAM